jgi:hypothetical protein
VNTDKTLHGAHEEVCSNVAQRQEVIDNTSTVTFIVVSHSRSRNGMQQRRKYLRFSNLNLNILFRRAEQN